MSVVPASTNAAASSQVAPLLPATADPPLPARRVSFVKAFALFWLFPRRYGPHLAVGSLRRALAAHGLALLLSGVVAGLTYLAQLGGFGFRDWHELRIHAAEAVLKAAGESVGSSIPWLIVALTLSAVPSFELGFVLLAILLMPWCADGDSARSVFKRSLRNVYWSTTIVLPVTLLGCGSKLLMNLRATWVHEWDAVLSLLIGLFVVGSLLGLTARMLLIGASRYVGEPDGPAFRPREPHCDECGYLIVGLPLTTNCPECGLAVRESLPGGRRRPTEFQKSELSPRGFLDLLRTQRLVLADPSFFKRLPVQQGLRTARHFWWGTFMLSVLFSLCFLRLILFWNNDSRVAEFYPIFTLVILSLPIVSQLLMMFCACLWSQVAYGIRDYRVAATTCYYASPLMWPWVLVLHLTAVLFTVPGPSIWYDRSIPVLQFQLTLGEVLLLCAVVLLIVADFFWWRRLARALRDVRYANV